MSLHSLTAQSLWLIGTIMIGVLTLASMAGPILVRRHVKLEQLQANNQVAGFKFATVGVLYAVLLGFAVIIAWEKFSDAENAAAEEAGAVATLYRLANGIGGNDGATLKISLTHYAKTAVEDDWPAMERGEVDQTTTRALDGTYAALLRYAPADNRGAKVQAEALRQLDVVTQARRVRLVLASGVMPGVLWFVLFAGATLTISFTLFFGSENLRVQAVMTGILAFLIFSGLLVIIGIDRPFTGTVKVRPEALTAVLEDFAGAP